MVGGLTSRQTREVFGSRSNAIIQMQLMNLQSFMVASILARMSHKLIGRSRPSTLGCADDPNYDRRCGRPSENLSFMGGHVAISMTGASLACAHHANAALLGGGLADDLACGAALTFVGAVWVNRLQADRHWFTDNVVGMAVGASAGYLLPSLLYYRPVRRRTADPSAFARNWRLIPMGGDDWFMLSIAGIH